MGSFGKRYLLDKPISPLPNGMIYAGVDLMLNRSVILYAIDSSDESYAENYIHLLRKASHYSEERFMHILDVGFDSASNRLFAVLKWCGGAPLVQEMSRQAMSFTGSVRLVHELGMAIQKAAGEGISGFSVAADNIWLNDENQPVVVNYWERGSDTQQVVKELCGLLYQLVTRVSSVPEERPAREAALQASLRTLPHQQTEAVLELVNRAASEDVPLPEFLASLEHLTELTDGEETLSAMSLIRRQEERFKAELPKEADEYRASSSRDEVELEEGAAGGGRRSFGWIFKRLFIAGGTFVVVAVLAGAILIWLLDSRKPNTVAQDPYAGQTSSSQHTPQQEPPKETLTSKPQNQQAGDPSSKGTPNLVGLSRDEAEKAALAAGLHYQFVIEANEQASNIVFRQEPMADTTVAAGGSIKFWVSKGK